MTNSYPRIVITGIGLTAPNGNSLPEFRQSLLTGKSGIQNYEIRYFGKTFAGICNFDPLKYQKKKDVRRGTRAGGIGIYCAHEAIADSSLDWDSLDKRRVCVCVGTTEHGKVERETEVYNISQFGYDCSVWTHHHNPRTVANNPAGEINLNMGITGPHICLGAACAAGNAGLIYGSQMLMLGECDVAIAGGVSESIHTFGIFAGFNSQGALAHGDDPTKISRPFDKSRTGIVVSEGGCLYTLERLDDALARGAKIYAEIVGYASNTDATDFVLPNAQRQAECVEEAIRRAGIQKNEIDIVSTHATGTNSGDIEECRGLRQVFADCPHVRFNGTKSFIGHCMGASAALELAGNIPSFEDGWIHPTINVDELDPECDLDGRLVMNQPVRQDNIRYILNNSFGMLGINAIVIIKKYEKE